MKSPIDSGVTRSLFTVLNELLHGTGPQGGYVLNRTDSGLLRSLEKLSAAQASAIPAGGGASIAAHVDHLCYGFELLNRWSAGEKDPFATANYAASWDRLTVSDEEWSARIEALRREAAAWMEAMQRPREVDD